MSNTPVTPKGEDLRRAIAWLAEQGPWTFALLEEACQRFDLSPADEEFLTQALRQQQGLGR